MKTYDRTETGTAKVDWEELILPKVWLYDEQGYLIIQTEEKPSPEAFKSQI